MPITEETHSVPLFTNLHRPPTSHLRTVPPNTEIFSVKATTMGKKQILARAIEIKNNHAFFLMFCHRFILPTYLREITVLDLYDPLIRCY